MIKKVIGKLLCIIGMHKPSPFTKYEIYGKVFSVCQRCKKIYDPN